MTLIVDVAPVGGAAISDFTLTLRGLAMGAGSRYPLAGPIDGFGIGGIRQSDTARLLDHGDFADRQFLEPRLLRWKVWLFADDVPDAVNLQEALVAAFGPVDPAVDGATTIPLSIHLGTDQEYLLYGKPGRVAVNIDLLTKAPPTPGANVEFNATDPRLYGGTVHSVSTGPGVVTGGLDVPHGFPHGFGAAQAGQVTATNDGTIGARPTITVTAGIGGLLDPVITHVESGRALYLDIALGQADTLAVDFAARSVTLNGTASRLGSLRRPDSQWFELAPGANTIRFDGSGAGTMTVEWRSAWIL